MLVIEITFIIDIRLFFFLIKCTKGTRGKLVAKKLGLPSQLCVEKGLSI